MFLWTMATAALAGAKVLVAFVAYSSGSAVPDTAPPALPIWIPASISAGYTLVGAALVAGGYADRRARTLGTFLLVVASAFSDPLTAAAGGLQDWAAVARAVRLDALLPYFFWVFASEFPVSAPAGSLRTLTTRCARLALLLGLGLMAANAAFDVGRLAPATPAASALARISRTTPGSLYWPLVFALALPATPVLAVRARRVTRAERRRIVVFVTAILAGLLPITVDVVLRSVSRLWNQWMAQPVAGGAVKGLVVGALLSVPFTTAYSVLVDQVVDVRLLARSALRYALARYSLLGLIGVPFAWLVWLVYSNRTSTIQELLRGPTAVVLVLAVALGLVALRLRRRLLDAIDRRFFREEYDAQQILTGLAEAARHADSTTRLVALIAAEVDRALHVDHVAVLVRDATGEFLEPCNWTAAFPAPAASARPPLSILTVPTLSASSLLVQLLSGSGEPLDVDLASPRSALGRLGAADRQWLTDTALRLLVPLHGGDGEVVGILGLGAKRSGLPYTAQDRRLLSAVGASGGIHLDQRLARETPSAARGGGAAGRPNDESDGALECFACGLVYRNGSTNCRCGSPLVSAFVPRMLAGKFRVVQRIGTGGMGVVYRAEDVALGRSVALKTLSGASVSRISRLRREARAMARVTHRNLELIYGLEVWQGRPVLVVEYLPGGTLSDRLSNGPLREREVVALGRELADALDALHSRGLLHRDVKPGNIGYSEGNVVKLLDFGIVKLFGSDTEAATESLSVAEGDGEGDDVLPPQSRSWRLVGTPGYMSPEALRSEPAEPSFDLWGLGVVMFEALTGFNPFGSVVLSPRGLRAPAGPPPDPRTRGTACSPELATFLAAALAVDRAKRPSTAREFAARLAGLVPTPT